MWILCNPLAITDGSFIIVDLACGHQNKNCRDHWSITGHNYSLQRTLSCHSTITNIVLAAPKLISNSRIATEKPEYNISYYKRPLIYKKLWPWYKHTCYNWSCSVTQMKCFSLTSCHTAKSYQILWEEHLPWPVVGSNETKILPLFLIQGLKVPKICRKLTKMPKWWIAVWLG